MKTQPANEIPPFFEELLSERYPAACVERILAGCMAERAVTLRANTLRAGREEVAQALDAAGLAWRTPSFYEDAFVIEGARERAVWDLAVYEQGKVYLQSLSSMIPALVLDARPGEDVCDMCAAPGGKTSQIAALTGNKAFVTACEMHAPRAEKLEYNLEKLGASRVTVMRTDARRLDDFFSFDRILLDAPCSGSGTLRLDGPKAQRRFTPALVAKSRKSQQALFAKALALMKPGGTLVYSTCSVLACENEDIVTEGLAKAKRLGTFEIEPIDAAMLCAPASQGAPSADGTDPDAAANPGAASGSSTAPGPEATAGDLSALPRLPTSIEGALALCPTRHYEGFFVVKIKRSA